MTGKDLKTIMGKLNLSGADVGRITGMSRAYVSQLLDNPKADIPDSSMRKIRSGFLKFHRDVAATYFTIEGGFVTEDEAA